MKRKLIPSAIALILATLGFLVLLAGCSGEGIQAVQDLVPLQEQLAAEYGGSSITVEIEDGNTLGVTFVNSLTNIRFDQYVNNRITRTIRVTQPKCGSDDHHASAH
jgi:hypothetical protein